MISSTHWGSDPHILSLFYKSFIGSKLDYGSFLYGSASKTQLAKLARFQNKALRLIIGGLSSTPIPALCAKTGITPLKFRRNYLTERFIARSISQVPAPIIPAMQNVSNNSRCTQWKLPLLCKRATILLKLEKFTLKLPPYRLSYLPTISQIQNTQTTQNRQLF